MPPHLPRFRGLVRRRGMSITARLLLIISLSIVPVLAIQVFSAWRQWSDRRAQLGDLASYQARMLAADVDSIAEGARLFLIAASVSQQVQALGSDCPGWLQTFRDNDPKFAFIARLDAQGRIRCASDAATRAAQGAGWVEAARAVTGFTAGRYSRSEVFSGGFLPFTLSLGRNGQGAEGWLVAGLDLGWLEQHLRNLKRGATPYQEGGILTVADADGVVLGRDARQAEFVGHRFPPAALSLLQATEPGLLSLASLDGTVRLIGYSPPTAEHSGLAVSVGLYEPDLLASTHTVLMRSVLLTLFVGLLAFAVTLLIARRSIAQPTQALLAVARRWREGDLAARAWAGGPASEFGQIAAAYNDMAARLQERDDDLRRHADAQEARVAERTRELTLANQRLQQEIAERRNTEAALLQAQKVQAMGQLAAGIAHDFNNVLQAIAGGISVIRDQAGDPATVGRFAAKLELAVERGASVTRRLLAFARSDAMREETLKLGELFEGLREVLGATLGGRIRIEVAVAPGLPPVVADRGQLETVLVNLATNARDAMPDGGVIRLSAVARDAMDAKAGREGGACIRIAVADTGMGMDAATLARASEPFFTTKPLGQGTGLGLAMARNFAERTGGALHIDSRPGEGTTVSLCLPVAAPAEGAGQAVRADAAQAGAGQRQRRVLLVDDEQMVLEVLAEQLALAGFEVREAPNGPAALARLAEAGQAVDLVVSDLAMPGMDGIELIRRVRQLRPDLPAILITGFAGDAATLEVARVIGGRFSLLRKPISGAELADEVSLLLAPVAQATVAQATVAQATVAHATGSAAVR